MRKRWIRLGAITLAVVMIATTMLALLPTLPAMAADPIDDKVTERAIEKVPPELQPTDARVIDAFVIKGADIEYVELVKDYGLRSKGKSPYSRTYADRQSNQRVLEVTQSPMVDAEGDKLRPAWFLSGSKYYTNSDDKSFNNLFWGEVYGTQITLVVVNDQPNGTKAGDKVILTPQLFLDGEEVFPLNTYAGRYDVDPANENYQYNVLEWDYGICKRQLRVIEGKLLGRWVFDSSPKGEVRIEYNQSGDFRLKLGQFAISDDEELIPADVFDNPKGYFLRYPIAIGDSITVYPDAHVESATFDGMTYSWTGSPGSGVSWATILTTAASVAEDDADEMSPNYFMPDSNSDKWRRKSVSQALFDVSGASGTVSAVTLSLYGATDYPDAGNDPDMNVYSAAPEENDGVNLDDHLNIGSTAYCDTPIPQSTFNFGTPGTANTFSFNSTGIAAAQSAVDGAGILKLGLRNANFDVAESAPDWYNVDDCGVTVWTADKGGDHRPKLVVTYGAVVAPTVTTQATDDITDTTATLNGTVTDDGDGTIDYYGFVWDDDSDEGDPGDVDPSTPAGTWENGWKSGEGDYGEATFDHAITGLPEGTTIHFRAAAHNEDGWVYGAADTFLTKPAAPTNIAASSNQEDKVTIT